MNNKNNSLVKIFITTNEKEQIFKELNCSIYCNSIEKQCFCNKFPNLPIDKELFNLYPYFCEITTMFWVEKNVISDYYGFFHYRRFFSFINKKHKLPALEGAISQDVLDFYKINDNEINEFVKKYDIILPYTKNLLITNGLFSSVYKQYKYSYDHNINDLQNAIDYIHTHCPQYDLCVKKVMKSKKMYTNNIFIMRSEYFKEYIKWITPILFYVHQNKNYSESSQYNKRSVGFVAERLFNVFIMYLKNKNPNIKIKECQMVHIGNKYSFDPSGKKGVKLKISEYSRFGCALRFIYHTLIGK